MQTKNKVIKECILLKIKIKEKHTFSLFDLFNYENIMLHRKEKLANKNFKNLNQKCLR